MFMKQSQVEQIRQQYPPGTRIRLNHMDDPYAPVPPGTEGVVSMIDDNGQLHVKWTNGRSLALIPGEDSFTVLSRPEQPLEEQAELEQHEQMGGMKFE